MALDAIVEAIGNVIIDYVFHRVFYWSGWVVLKVITFGRYPPPQSQSHNRDFVAVFFLILLGIGATIFWYL
jgi:hypothetical protein